MEKIIHCIENLSIPYNAKEWDDSKDNARRHRWRMKLNLKEVQIMISIKTIFNCLLLLPMAYLGIFETRVVRFFNEIFHAFSFHLLQFTR